MADPLRELPADRLPGPHVHYLLNAPLGRGGQGVVYLAESLRQPGVGLAIKFIREPAWGATPALVEAFIGEALFGRELRSHHLGHTLELLDLRPWTGDGWPPVALVMEYYACSLEQVLRACDDSFRFPSSQDALPRQRCVPAMDLFSFGLVLRELAKVTEGDAKWLEDAAADCTQPEPGRRPRAADLFLRLAPDWDEQVRLIREAGHRPEQHRDFEGRTFITEGAFEPFAQSCGDRGGIFVIEGPAGVGKTALLTNWPERAGQPFGFYFRYRDNRTRAAAMPQAIAEQLGRRFGLEFRPPADDQDWTATLERLCADVARQPAAPQRLLIFVDGLDEADDPARAVGFIPKTLPRGVFVIASTRPPARGKDHLALLRAAGAHLFPLRADDRRSDEWQSRVRGEKDPWRRSSHTTGLPEDPAAKPPAGP